MPKRPCAQPGCSELVAKGYCAAHAKVATLYDAHRGSAASRGYDADWERAKKKALERDGYLCQPCKRRKVMRPATEVDHIVALVDGGARLELSNLESTCHSDHVKKTWRERRARVGGIKSLPSSAALDRPLP